ncbi:hypothetical protein [Marinobacter lutaoensis]|uniref:hypothetical protein n=1 Tax=Marinobacter lutaoensis TaxID=135739 RepID=UPI0034A0CA40
MCPDGICSSHDGDGKVMYYDPSHLSLPASRKLGRRIVAQQDVPFPFSDMAQYPASGVRNRVLFRQP